MGSICSLISIIPGFPHVNHAGASGGSHRLDEALLSFLVETWGVNLVISSVHRIQDEVK